MSVLSFFLSFLLSFFSFFFSFLLTSFLEILLPACLCIDASWVTDCLGQRRLQWHCPNPLPFAVGSDRPWDPVNDVYQYEHAFVVQTQTRHKTPHLRATSLSSLNKSVEKKKLRIPRTVEESDSSGHGLHRESDSSDYVGKCQGSLSSPFCEPQLSKLPV